ncbi:protein phosphatase CheZ [Rhodanobacter denitrificans]|uniref:Protein phosphatase CheZ n=1 Tax=Rhodanobacter denitrificans TaxID=666685 RepID=I4WYY3_9GAMM|nr:protein phosphatase CheZ [Rhodanobacter denitrificans]AGG90053.1 chemotaxis protein [Rhodanobacter denitrificans]EIM04675.1 chemotaxis protein [Rhodanobacter denitrificans]UJM85444.1 protein phosphatase CheZ [Rhodanobacter denitrificans]UJM91513.1 protein phosphatase CheZ [Rhodanobacter denitrificans]
MNVSSPLAIDETLPPELRDLLNSPDGQAFEQALDVMVRQREQRLFRALGQLARDLHDAVRRLGGELTQEGVPGIVADARQHLQDALEMSAQAAHRSLDFAERMRPQAESLTRNAGQVLEWTNGNDAAAVLAREAVAFAGSCRDGLADMVLAQSWQDLTGQRIKKVASFIGTVESSLLELVRLTGALAGSEAPAKAAKVSSQEDADRLLSEFGF